jgi:hypothetical protein
MPTTTPGTRTVSSSTTLLTQAEIDAKKVQDENEAREKELKEKRDKEPALGPYAGGKLREGNLGEGSILTEVYVGTGPLAVPCTRGEQKAISGDTIVQLIVEHEDRDDEELLFIIPFSTEGAEAVLGSTKELTNADYDVILNEKSARAARKEAKKAELSAKTPTTSTRLGSAAISGTSQTTSAGMKTAPPTK